MNIPDGNAILAGLTAFGVTYLLMPSITRYARQRAWVDEPDGGRKQHASATPRTGGVAIWFGIVAGVLVSLFLTTGAGAGVGLLALPFNLVTALAILAGGSVAALVGFYDDTRPLGAPIKLFAQIVAATPLVASPEFIGAVTQLLGGGVVAQVVAYPAVVFWMVFVMNAINLIDGLDGLAGGLTVIAISFFVILGGLTGGPLLLALSLMGAVLAFLRYNLPPARVFMGDTGSLLIGYVLGVLALVVVQAEPTTNRAMAVLVILGIPGLDTAMSVVRRLALGRNPLKADHDHLHHRMLKRARGIHARAVTIFYLIGCTLGLLGLLIAFADTVGANIIVGVVGALAMIVLWDLGYFDITTYANVGKGVDAKPREVQRRAPAATGSRARNFRSPMRRGVTAQ
ncbi:MAG: undecaprenyl/decaprenyl-phosphate alpha-N-acetylglucosaminyl 1-phosphate transferase [Rhodothermales bacterium]|nr:undecaprenyl/decaprenyl-phosphate alpha-N-acetylglucosaminyl 1-phosphate transferase [Rhodothermales bacterium]MBO6780746.1 undecaprenyl/decaprenyl-phosphate alpha-N-acetylglucosaminyl 1-phosphate transferase [Rhodothermales bacterium]